MPYPKQATNVYVEKLDDELCVYDWEQNRMHALNPTAAMVWEQCDGKTDPAEMANRLESELKVPNADKLVTLSLSRLEKARLLDGTARSQTLRTITRREVLKMAGISLALLPVISSIALPSPAEAQSSCNENCTYGGTLSTSGGFNNCTDACIGNAPPRASGFMLCSVESTPLNGDTLCVCHVYVDGGCNNTTSTASGTWQ